MRCESPQGKAHPFSRRMMPPTPLQNSYASFEGEQERYEVEGWGWSAKERTLIARTQQFLERSHSVKVQVEELQDQFGPEDLDVDFRRILKEARDERGRKMVWAISWWPSGRWDKYKRAPWRKDSSASARDGWWQASLGQSQEQMIVGWSQDDKRVIDAVEDVLEKCAQVIVKLIANARKPHGLLRVRLEARKLRGSNIVQIFDTKEKPNHIVASRRRWLESQGTDDARQESGRNE